MNNTHCKNKEHSEKELKQLLRERGRRVFEMVKETILEEPLECREIEDALKYFAQEYWSDLARPTLLSLCCEAVGGNPEKVIPVAISLSLISGGVDIHDDIIDLSEVKNKRPTVYGKYGKDIALLAGDALIFKGLTHLNELNTKISREKVTVISKVLRATFFELGDAEATELRFRGRVDVSPKEYLTVVRKKAADVEAHTRIGAILGDGTKEERSILGRYGRNLGMLLILSDDNADMINFEELLHRMKKEHPPFPMLLAQEDLEIRSRIVEALDKKHLKKADARKVFDLVYNSKAFDYVGKVMRDLILDGLLGLEKLRYCRTELEWLIRGTYVEKDVSI